MSKVSIIVPVYNIYNYIDQCIDSLVNQTFKNIEIIIVNDSSTDNVEEKLKIWREKDSRIKVINNNDNKGLSYSRNIGIQHSSGEYISFIDGDDWCELTMIEKLYLALAENNADYTFCGRYSVYSDGKIKEDIGNINLRNPVTLREDKSILFNMFCTVWNKMYRKTLLIDNNIFFNTHVIVSEDIPFTSSVLSKAKKIIQVKESLYYYRRNRVGSLTDIDSYSLLKRKQALIETIRYFKDNNLYEEYYYELEKLIVMITLSIIKQGFNINNKEISKDIMLTYLDFLNTNFTYWRVNMYLSNYDEKLFKEIGFFNFIDSRYDKNKDTVIFSASKGGEKIMRFLRKFDIYPKRICDNSKEKQGSYINGVKVVSPKEMVEELGVDINLIIASATYYDEIKKQMMDMGIDENNILFCESILYES